MHFHKRDKQGALVPPTPDAPKVKTKPPQTLEQELAQLEALRNWVAADNFAQMEATVKQKWASGERNGRRQQETN